jgi:hypothetical protein
MPLPTRALCFLLCCLPAAALAIDNAWVRVSRDAAPCAVATAAGCGYRVLVALAELDLRAGDASRRLVRGEIAVFGPGQDYAAPSGSFFEVAIKPGHPPALAPAEIIAAEKNAPLYDGEDFFVFEERLAPGDTRARHSHSQRVVIQLNRARLQQWPDRAPELFVETVPERPSFSPPVIHIVKNVGDVPLRGIVIEFKPGR